MLTGRMRIHLLADLAHQQSRFRFITARDGITKSDIVAILEHRAMREIQSEDWIVWHVVPVDQLIQHISICSEWENLRDDRHGFPHRFGYSPPLRCAHNRFAVIGRERFCHTNSSLMEISPQAYAGKR